MYQLFSYRMMNVQGERHRFSFFVSLSWVTGLEFIVLICYRVRVRRSSYIRWFGIFKLSCQDLTLSLLACIALHHTRRWGPWSTQGVVTGVNQGLMSLLTTPYTSCVGGGACQLTPGCLCDTGLSCAWFAATLSSDTLDVTNKEKQGR